MSNVYKNGFVQITHLNNTRVIDGNALAAKHIEKHSSVFRELSSTAEEVELQPFEDETPEDESAVDRETDGFDALSVPVIENDEITLNADDVRAECDEMIRKANELAEAAREKARNDAAVILENARKEGYEAGLNQAYEECNAAVETAKQQMAEEIAGIRNEYQMLIQEAEPKMVEVISTVYHRIFGDGLCDVRQVLSYLINKTLLKLDGDEQVFIFVNPEDYDELEPKKDELFKRLSLTKIPELKPREDMIRGQAKIETAYGILDCGIDTQLSELEKKLKMLSMEE